MDYSWCAIPKPPRPRKRLPSGYIPPAVRQQVLDRAQGRCEGPECPDPTGGWLGLQFCHRFATGAPFKGMGGTRRICTADDVWLGCNYCHNTRDHKHRMVRPEQGLDRP